MHFGICEMGVLVQRDLSTYKCHHTSIRFPITKIRALIQYEDSLEDDNKVILSPHWEFLCQKDVIFVLNQPRLVSITGITISQKMILILKQGPLSHNNMSSLIIQNLHILFVPRTLHSYHICFKNTIYDTWSGIKSDIWRGFPLKLQSYNHSMSFQKPKITADSFMSRICHIKNWSLN